MPRLMAARLVSQLVEISGRSTNSPDPALAGLTTREEEVLRLLAAGLTDREIAESLTISGRTVEAHVSSVFHELGARNRAEVARRYPDAG